MPRLPEGLVPPVDGRLPEGSTRAWGERPFGIYLHIPFCTTRCGYCDFNTYTPAQLAGIEGVERTSFAAQLATELDLARRVLGDRNVPVESVFIGGGTPTLMSPADLGSVLDRVRERFGLRPGAEVTVEANPDSVDEASLTGLLEQGINRISFGMQSAVPHVLRVLDRTHTPGGALRAVEQARAAGFDRISLDLIYGTPGESLADWRRTVEVAVASGVRHVSAYALIVEEGTRLAARVQRGELEAPDDDLMADMYDLADDALQGAGLPWYELSNWAQPGHECRHNLAYWHGDDWWGVGPGAHSHVSGTRWWNVKHPARYVAALAEGRSPAAGVEYLDAATRQVEDVLLRIRLREGLPMAALPVGADVDGLRAHGLVDVDRPGRIVLTRPGRLLADAVVRRLV